MGFHTAVSGFPFAGLHKQPIQIHICLSLVWRGAGLDTTLLSLILGLCIACALPVTRSCYSPCAHGMFMWTSQRSASVLWNGHCSGIAAEIRANRCLELSLMLYSFRSMIRGWIILCRSWMLSTSCWLIVLSDATKLDREKQCWGQEEVSVESGLPDGSSGLGISSRYVLSENLIGRRLGRTRQ